MKIDLVPDKNKAIMLFEMPDGSFMLKLEGMEVDGINSFGGQRIETVYSLMREIIAQVFYCKVEETK